MARSLPPGEHRSALLEMAEQWDRLAAQQDPRHGSEQEKISRLAQSADIGAFDLLLSLVLRRMQ
jgi:hypothetical protein